MASDSEASCESDPNFAVICAFMEKFGTTCGLASIDFLELQEMLENTQEVSQELIDLHVKLLRKSKKSVSNERWERAVIKFCHTFCTQDAWEIERFGYKKARLSSKLRLLKELLEMQFDLNSKFKAEINKMTAEELRSQPLGKDIHGHAYWFQNDNNCQIRVYKEDPDEETWTLVAKDRDGLISLMNELSDGDSKISSESGINEDDSNSLAEKPIIDTGQVDSSSSESIKKGESENSNEKEEKENISPKGEDDNARMGDEDESVKRPIDAEDSESKKMKVGEVIEEPLMLVKGEDNSNEKEEKENISPKGEDDNAQMGDEDESVKQPIDAEKMKVSEVIEEPLMLVKGEGSGEDNNSPNPIVGEVIEEQVMYVFGLGSGAECETGNEDKSGSEQNSINSGGSSKEIPAKTVKLGTIYDTKTDNNFLNAVKSPTKKSRWDVETIISKEPCDSETTSTKSSMFFFGPGCVNTFNVGFGQKVPENSVEDVGYRISASPKEPEVEDKSEQSKEALTRVEGEIVMDTEVDKCEGRLPEVTAALVGVEVPSADVVCIKPPSTIPVVEKECVKEESYVLGDTKNELTRISHGIETILSASVETQEVKPAKSNSVKLTEEEECPKKQAKNVALKSEGGVEEIKGHIELTEPEGLVIPDVKKPPTRHNLAEGEADKIISSELTSAESEPLENKIKAVEKSVNNKLTTRLNLRAEPSEVKGTVDENPITNLELKVVCSKESTELKAEPSNVKDNIQTPSIGLKAESSKDSAKGDVKLKLTEAPAANVKKSPTIVEVKSEASKISAAVIEPTTKVELTAGPSSSKRIEVPPLTSKKSTTVVELKPEASKISANECSKQTTDIELKAEPSASKAVEVPSDKKSTTTVQRKAEAPAGAGKLELKADPSTPKAGVKKSTSTVEAKSEPVNEPTSKVELKAGPSNPKTVEVPISFDKKSTIVGELKAEVSEIRTRKEGSGAAKPQLKAELSFPKKAEAPTPTNRKSTTVCELKAEVSKITATVVSDATKPELKAEDLSSSKKTEIPTPTNKKSITVGELKAEASTISGTVVSGTTKPELKAELSTSKKTEVPTPANKKTITVCELKAEISKISTTVVSDATKPELKATDLSSSKKTETPTPTNKKSTTVGELKAETSKISATEVSGAAKSELKAAELSISKKTEVPTPTNRKSTTVVQLKAETSKGSEATKPKLKAGLSTLKKTELPAPTNKKSTVGELKAEGIEVSGATKLDLKADISTSKKGEIPAPTDKIPTSTILSATSDNEQITIDLISKTVEVPVTSNKKSASVRELKAEASEISTPEASGASKLELRAELSVIKDNKPTTIVESKAGASKVSPASDNEPKTKSELPTPKNTEVSPSSDKKSNLTSDPSDSKCVPLDLRDNKPSTIESFDPKLESSKAQEPEMPESESRLDKESKNKKIKLFRDESEVIVTSEGENSGHEGPFQQPRRGRPRLLPKVDKEEGGKKIKLSEEEKIEAGPGNFRRTRSRLLPKTDEDSNSSQEDKIEQLKRNRPRLMPKIEKDEVKEEEEGQPRRGRPRLLPKTVKAADEDPLALPSQHDKPETPRRGRPRLLPKVDKEADGESNKKIKLSEEAAELGLEEKAEPPRRGRSRLWPRIEEPKSPPNEVTSSDLNLEEKPKRGRPRLLPKADKDNSEGNDNYQEEIRKNRPRLLPKKEEVMGATNNEQEDKVIPPLLPNVEKQEQPNSEVIESKKGEEEKPEDLTNEAVDMSKSSEEKVEPRRGRSRLLPKSDKEEEKEEVILCSEDNKLPKPEEVTESIESEDKPMTISTLSFDFTDSPKRPLRKRSHEGSEQQDQAEDSPEKRIKMKAKRPVDVQLRKSIEEQKKKELASSDDSETEKKKKSKHKREEVVVLSDTEDLVVLSSGAEDTKPKPKKKKKSKNRILSNLGIDPDNQVDVAPIGIRQSRRIAQLKIREEAERRKLEDEVMKEAEDHHKKKKSKKDRDKDYKSEKKKKKVVEEDDEEEGGDSGSEKKKHKKKKVYKFDMHNPWKSSSDDSSSSDDTALEEEEEHEEEDVLHFVSDHEFSPESDLEDEEWQPLKRARTVKKESDVEEEVVDDCPCQKCSKSDHPEWILLCDLCDNGWHCSCLRPPLLVIPEGDWFCPPCQHATLLKNLQEKLVEYDKMLSRKEVEDRRKQRLAYVGISLNNVLPTKEGEQHKKKKKIRVRAEDDEDDGDEAEIDDDESATGESESESGSSSASGSGSESDEPIYQLRQRRQAHSYRFNDYDDLINSAIQDEMEAVKGAGNQGRGKDIATIVNAEKEEEEQRHKENEEEEPGPEEIATGEPVTAESQLEEPEKEVYSDDEPIKPKKKLIGRKKHRKLNSLDISSDEDGDSDEDFKGTSESDDELDDDLGSEDSEELELLRGGRRKNMDPIRRSTRARTSRYDADFIDDNDSESDEAPKRKKKRAVWEDTESEEESDRSWGRRKRKQGSKSRKTPNPAKKKSKKKKSNDDSDAEVYKKKKPKIKFGLDDDDDGPVRRTRGKKINYLDALGSDSEEERVKRPVPRIESEEEYVANEEDEDKSGEESGGEKVQIQSYADPRYTQLLPEGVPTPSKKTAVDDCDDEPNPIDVINRNLEAMGENEMEKMMEEEEYANKQLQLVALQIEKEKKRLAREQAKKLAAMTPPQPQPLIQEQPKKRGRKPKNQFQFTGTIQEPIVGNVNSLLVNSENNDELSEPPGVSLPMFSELPDDDVAKKRRVPGQVESNIEIAAPPQPFSQSQITPSVITRMLQNKPGQPGYPVGAIRPKQFAVEHEEEGGSLPGSHSMSPAPAHHVGSPGPYLQGAAIRSPYRQMPANMNHYPRGAPPPPHQIRNPVPQNIPSHVYHSHPASGGPVHLGGHNSPGRVVSPAAGSPGNKNDTPPPPYVRAPTGRFPLNSPGGTPRHLQVPLLPPRTSLSPYHPNMPPSYHYGQFGQPPPIGEEAMPPSVYQNSPYPEHFEGQVHPSENSNSKSFDEESGGEFVGLVSYFSSQREDDLES